MKKTKTISTFQIVCVFAMTLLLAINVGAQNQINSSTEKLAELSKDFSKTDINEVRNLIHNGADVNHRGDIGWTPLMLASYQSQEDIVQLLMDSGADINATSNDGYNLMAIHCAALKDKSIVKLLLDAGVEVNVSDSNGQTPLHLACYSGQVEIVRLLISYNAAVNLPAKNHATPISLASSQGHIDVVKLLLDKGVDPNTNLIATVENGRTEILSLLIEYGADLNFEGDDGIDLLSIAHKNSNKSTVKILCKYNDYRYGVIDEETFISYDDLEGKYNGENISVGRIWVGDGPDDSIIMGFPVPSSTNNTSGNAMFSGCSGIWTMGNLYFFGEMEILDGGIKVSRQSVIVFPE